MLCFAEKSTTRALFASKLRVSGAPARADNYSNRLFVRIAFILRPSRLTFVRLGGGTSFLLCADSRDVTYFIKQTRRKGFVTRFRLCHFFCLYSLVSGIDHFFTRD